MRLESRSSDKVLLKYIFTRSKQLNALSSWADETGRVNAKRINFDIFSKDGVKIIFFRNCSKSW